MSKKKILLILLGCVIAIVLLPIVLEIFVFRNNFYSVLGNEYWSGFLGSYIGGVFGGIGTLLAVYITTKETRRIQNETKQQIKDEREEDRKRNRKRFADEISQIVAKYITDISKYFYSNRALERLDNDRCRILQELNNTQHEIDRQYKKKKSLNIDQDSEEYLKTDLEIGQLGERKLSIMIKLQNVERDIENNRVNRTIAIECYFLLKIKLKEIDEAQGFLKQLEYIHKHSADVYGTDLDFIQAETNKLLDLTVKFSDSFVNSLK